MAFSPNNMDEYSRTPPRTAPRRFDPRAAAGSFERSNKEEKIRPANPTGSANNKLPTKLLSSKGSRFRIPAPVNHVAKREIASGR
jgi:hypothetical protein